MSNLAKYGRGVCFEYLEGRQCGGRCGRPRDEKHPTMTVYARASGGARVRLSHWLPEWHARAAAGARPHSETTPKCILDMSP